MNTINIANFIYCLSQIQKLHRFYVLSSMNNSFATTESILTDGS